MHSALCYARTANPRQRAGSTSTRIVLPERPLFRGSAPTYLKRNAAVSLFGVIADLSRMCSTSNFLLASFWEETVV
ncbi:hypothetical protein EJ02DRAFT_130006 [Clathrospora elynae]|uniref:Uncharacterized protein n=1 Tax=Clathrospora elynae TaxID=706981 RepID=A0A6A5SUH5_9PLEO|nr:hypothetical protein EJ02DRAFT_130006 [Clathrospora elynae]